MFTWEAVLFAHLMTGFVVALKSYLTKNGRAKIRYAKVISPNKWVVPVGMIAGIFVSALMGVFAAWMDIRNESVKEKMRDMPVWTLKLGSNAVASELTTSDAYLYIEEIMRDSENAAVRTETMLDYENQEIVVFRY